MDEVERPNKRQRNDAGASKVQSSRLLDERTFSAMT
jgi:hypothetical protein